MTTSEIEKLAISVKLPPYSIVDIIRIQTAVYKKTGKHYSYGAVSSAVASLDKKHRKTKPLPTVQEKEYKTRECCRCGGIFKGSARRNICDECHIKRARERARERIRRLKERAKNGLETSGN